MDETKECPICNLVFADFVRSEDGYLSCPQCGAIAFEALIIRITNPRNFLAPEWVRRHLVGIDLLAEPVDGGDGFLVLKEVVLDILSKKSAEAAAWIAGDPKNRLEEYYVFGLDEAEILREFMVMTDMQDIADMSLPLNERLLQ